jgi:hypothetical protein
MLLQKLGITSPTREAEIRRTAIQGQQSKTLVSPPQRTSPEWWYRPVIPDIQEEDHCLRPCQAKTRDLIQKITKAKKGWGCGSNGRIPA